MLAKYKREKPDVHPAGSLVAVSAAFNCWGLRNGLIRAIHRESEASTRPTGMSWWR